jgi:N-acetylmuramoyl-L-alanine amidase
MPPRGYRPRARIPARPLALLMAAALAAGLAACSAPDPDRLSLASRAARPEHTDQVRPRLAARHRSGVSVDPAYFSPGACRLFAPLHGNRGLTVFLDAGHGGPDSGAAGVTSSGRTIVEARETLPVVMDATMLLRSDGFTVVVSRTDDGPVARLGPGDTSGRVLTADGVRDDVAARDVCADRTHASALVGVYDNSGAGGAGCITAYDPARSFAAANRRLARLVQSDVLGAMNSRGWDIPDAGVASDTELGSAVTATDAAYGHLILLGPAQRGYFTTPSLMPGALIEPLFITDPFEASIAASSRGQHVIATGLAHAIEQYFAPLTLSPAGHRSQRMPGLG